MKLNKKEIEEQSENTLREMFRDYNQEDGIISLEYDEDTQTCTVKLCVVVIEEDNYAGFNAY